MPQRIDDDGCHEEGIPGGFPLVGKLIARLQWQTNARITRMPAQQEGRIEGVRDMID